MLVCLSVAADDEDGRAAGDPPLMPDSEELLCGSFSSGSVVLGEELLS